jgi:GDPmannose 4,6-dehydratase
MNKKVAFITGGQGQDSSYLSELLLSKNYVVHSMVRRSSNITHPRIDHLRNNPDFILHYGDVRDFSNVFSLVKDIEPDEIYNLAAMSHVRYSFDLPIESYESIALGTLNVLESIRLNGLVNTRMYQSSSSEQFGSSPAPQSEDTVFSPRSPYAVAKTCAHYQTINHREAYGVHASCGILFNHTSERRPENFVCRKICRAAAAIKLGLQADVELGRTDPKRDFLHAKDAVRAMWLMLQQDSPDEYVIASGETHSIQEILEVAFGYVNLDYKKYLKFNPIFTRPSEVEILQGDSTKARTRLGWKPTISFVELIENMTKHDLEELQK